MNLQIAVSPAHGCNTYDKALPNHRRVAVLVDRGTCAFDTKAFNALAAGASAVVVINSPQSVR